MDGLERTSSGGVVEVGGHLVRNGPPRTCSMTLEAAGSLEWDSLRLVGRCSNGGGVGIGLALAAETGATTEQF